MTTYTVQDIQALRDVVRNLLSWGAPHPPLLKAGEPSWACGHPYTESQVEDQVRTYIAAGLKAQDFASSSHGESKT